jgi:hypothetical protein
MFDVDPSEWTRCPFKSRNPNHPRLGTHVDDGIAAVAFGIFLRTRKQGSLADAYREAQTPHSHWCPQHQRQNKAANRGPQIAGKKEVCCPAYSISHSCLTDISAIWRLEVRSLDHSQLAPRDQDLLSLTQMEMDIFVILCHPPCFFARQQAEPRRYGRSRLTNHESRSCSSLDQDGISCAGIHATAAPRILLDS